MSAMPSSKASSQPRNQTCVSYVSCVGRQVLHHWHHLGSPFVHCHCQLLSCVWLLLIPWTAACQSSLSLTVSWSLLKFMSIESVMLSNHLILCHLLLLLPSISCHFWLLIYETLSKSQSVFRKGRHEIDAHIWRSNVLVDLLFAI